MSLLLGRPIPRSSIELGRLVLDPKYPTHDYCQPTITKDNRSTPGQVDDVGIPVDLKIESQKYENFLETIECARGTRLEARLLNILSLAPSIPSKTFTSISGPLCVFHELSNTNEFFRAICRQPRVRIWLEEQSQRMRSTVYLVCGFKVLTDANVSLARTRGSNFEASVNAPSALVAVAAGGVPLPGLEVEVGVDILRETSKKAEYTAVGEQVFAVQYRKVSFTWFAGRKADKAFLAKGNRWISYVQARAGESEEDGDVIECKIAGEIGLSDLGERYTSSDVNGKTILHRADTN